MSFVKIILDDDSEYFMSVHDLVKFPESLLHLSYSMYRDSTIRLNYFTSKEFEKILHFYENGFWLESYGFPEMSNTIGADYVTFGKIPALGFLNLPSISEYSTDEDSD